jgi:uncharacterized membrane protein YgcG
MELIASFGWVIQWYSEFCNDIIHHTQSTIGRGFTFDDPDMWANVTLLIAAYHYFKYNVIVYMDTNEYDTNFLFVKGDFYYALNALLYTICSMRDNDFFWFMPTNGRLPNIPEMARAYYYSAGVSSPGLGSSSTDSIGSPTSSASSGGHADGPQVGWWHVMSFFRFAFAPVYFVFGSFPSKARSRSSMSTGGNGNNSSSSGGGGILRLSPSNSFVSAALKASKSEQDLENLIFSNSREHDLAARMDVAPRSGRVSSSADYSVSQLTASGMVSAGLQGNSLVHSTSGPANAR